MRFSSATDVPGLTFPARLHAHEDFGWVCAVPSVIG